jgi:hypothetical protein
VPGIVVPGHGVASHAGDESPYPDGTIAMQLPHFRRLGLDLSPYRAATINVFIGPAVFAMRAPRYTLRHVEWTTLHPPEDFSFSPCRVAYADEIYEGLVYYPHPETKARHFQHFSTIEVIAVHIPGVGYGSRVELHLRRNEIDVREDESPGDTHAIP